MGVFMLSGSDNDTKLVRFESKSVGSKTTIVITIEAIDLSTAGWALRSLDEVQKEQAARSKKAPKPAPKG
ncbi:hypothetical protein FBT96_12395 [Rhodobacter capsulatus]|uniref:Uncharacterized protein n=1 Tax=Rhodobacter capsulatus TaxID=1061 RepID=A0A4U1JPJ8_RHOCA|nr:hypothetical protein [Rhodobacter capsulatus]TKD17937.1 hypothetical protein FBT96_12395 [Rhodobacter capsulatus]